MGADTLRVEVKWNEVAPLPLRAHQAGLRRVQPGRVSRASAPMTTDPAARGRSGCGSSSRITGDAPRWATAGGRGRSSATANWKVSAGEYGRFATRGRATLLGALRRAAGRELLHDLERAQPPQLPEADVGRAARVPQDGRHRAAADPPRTGRAACACSWASLRRSAARRSRWARRSSCAGGCASNRRLKRTSSGRDAGSFKRINADGFAHHPYGPTERVPRKRDVINMLAIRTLATYLDRARRATPLHPHAERSTTPSSASRATRPTGS